MSKTYIHYEHTSFNKEMFVEIKNEENCTKPYGGLWGSAVDAEYGWKQWNEDNHFKDCKHEDSFCFNIKENAKVLSINTVSDLEKLPRTPDTLGLKALNLSMWTYLNFEKFKNEYGYDAIEVNISNDNALYYKLYGWDCDSILIMNPDVVIKI